MTKPKNIINLILCWIFIGSISAQPLLETKNLYFLNQDQEALQSRIWIINQAQEEILISYFIFQDDDIGIFFLSELIRLKKQNPDLSIKIIQDAFEGGISDNIMYYLGKLDIQIKKYHPLPKIFMPFSHINGTKFRDAIKNFNHRMHDKLLIVDGELIISGGRNIDESYFGLETKNFYDRELLIKSKKVGAISRDYFNKLWSSTHVESLCPDIDYSLTKYYAKDLRCFITAKENLIDFHQLTYLDEENFHFIPKWISAENIQFYHSYSEIQKEFEPKYLSKIFIEILKTAKEEIIIESPYLLLTTPQMDLISAFRDKNVRVIFITNSFCSNDVAAIAGAYDSRKTKLLELGVELYEYAGQNYLHAKCAIIDRKTGLVGSYNIDPRSAYLNTETFYSFEGHDAINILYRQFQNDIQMSNKLSLDQGNIVGMEMDCEKSFIDWFLYIFFQSFSQLKWVYNLL